MAEDRAINSFISECDKVILECENLIDAVKRFTGKNFGEKLNFNRQRWSNAEGTDEDLENFEKFLNDFSDIEGFKIAWETKLLPKIIEMEKMLKNMHPQYLVIISSLPNAFSDSDYYAKFYPELFEFPERFLLPKGSGRINDAFINKDLGLLKHSCGILLYIALVQVPYQLRFYMVELISHISK